MQNVICFPFVKVVIFLEIEDQFIGIFRQKFSGLFLFLNSLGKFSMGPEPLSSSSTSSNLHDYLFTSLETAFVMKLILSNWTGFLALCICIHSPGLPNIYYLESNY